MYTIRIPSIFYVYLYICRVIACRDMILLLELQSSRTRETTKEKEKPVRLQPNLKYLSTLALSLSYSIIILQHSPLLHLKRIPSLAPNTNNSPLIIITTLHILASLLRPKRPIRSMPLRTKRRPRVQHTQ